MSRKRGRKRNNRPQRPRDPAAKPFDAEADARLNEVMQQAGRLHGAGRLEDALGLYRQVLGARPDHIEALHFGGVASFQSGDTEQGIAMLRRMLALQPEHAQGHMNLGNMLMASGDLDAAEAAYRQALEITPRAAEVHYNLANVLRQAGKRETALASYRHAIEIRRDLPEAHNNMGMLLQEMGRYEEAADAYQHALRLVPAYIEARFNLGNVLQELSRHDEAVEAYRHVIKLQPDFAEAHCNLGNSLRLLGDFEGAVTAFRRSLDARPGHAVVHYNLGNILHELGLHEEALEAYRDAIALDADYAEAYNNLGYSLMNLGRTAEAFATFETSTAIRRSLDGAPRDDAHSLGRTSESKLRHDIEQFRHLSARGLLPQQFGDVVSVYEAALAALPEPSPESHIVDIPDGHLARLAPTYNRLVYRAEAPALAGGAVNRGLDVAAIEADYHCNAPGITYFDDLLTPEALASFRRFCLESTLWYGFQYPNGYLGAVVEDGFHCPLLLQIAEELRRALPGIIGDHPLLEAWAYKYDDAKQGIDVHADFAAINVNFWITPDDANLDPASGGLVVWDKEAPADWDFKRYNKNVAAIWNFLEQSGANRRVIPYKENRVVVFNSDLFHGTDTIRFRSGYENRRINVTLLYGERGA